VVRHIRCKPDLLIFTLSHYFQLTHQGVRMKTVAFSASAFGFALALLSMSAAQAQQLDFKGKLKEGLYETTIQSDMPGMPKGAGAQPFKAQQCVTKEDIDRGNAKTFNQDAMKQNSSCEMRNMKQSGNSASYDMVCPREGFSASTQLTFGDNSVKGATTTKFTGEQMKNMPPQVAAAMTNMKSTFETKYIGPCKK
jgi:Protein of unknown function (DUF3617)